MLHGCMLYTPYSVLHTEYPLKWSIRNRIRRMHGSRADKSRELHPEFKTGRGLEWPVMFLGPIIINTGAGTWMFLLWRSTELHVLLHAYWPSPLDKPPRTVVPIPSNSQWLTIFESGETARGKTSTPVHPCSTYSTQYTLIRQIVLRETHRVVNSVSDASISHRCRSVLRRSGSCGLFNSL